MNVVKHQNRGGALGQYQSVAVYGAVGGADKLRLVQLMMHGALDAMATAKGHIARAEISAKGEQIGKAIQLIDGLRASLDRDQGEEIARNLENLYDYMTRRLLEANMRDSVEIVDEVAALLTEVRTAWDDVLSQANELLGSAEQTVPEPGAAP